MNNCQVCGQPVGGEERWRVFCKGCFIQKKRDEENDREMELISLRRRVRELERAQKVSSGPSPYGPGLSLPRIRQLIQLCHPDKHSGSKTSLEVTQWLLQLKDKL